MCSLPRPKHGLNVGQNYATDPGISPVSTVPWLHIELLSMMASLRLRRTVFRVRPSPGQALGMPMADTAHQVGDTASAEDEQGRLCISHALHPPLVEPRDHHDSQTTPPPQ